jgi:hypothetical protein
MDLATRRRDVLLFLAGPVAIWLLCAAAFRISPWPLPFPGQASLLNPLVQWPWLLFGAAGVMLAPAAGIANAPEGSRGWTRLVLAAVIPGAVIGAIQLGADFHFNLTQTQGHALGGPGWVNPPLPGSLWMSTAAAIVLECMFRLAPIPFFVALVSGVLLRGKHQSKVFWTAAVLTSLIEPSQQIGPALKPGQAPEIQAVLLIMTATIFATNFLEAVEFKRWGWSAPILLRLGFYSVFHSLGPYLLPSGSFLYPGPR